MNGIINVNKPAGWTSQDVCAKLRGLLHIKKIGHTGTLDPMATGVLPVCIGKATRIIEYYDADYKSYHAVMQLGTVTDTLDITGEILETHDYSVVNESMLREAFKAYTGVVEQLPPKYSALRVNGKRAYELAREGVEFELKTRKVEITKNEISHMDLDSGIIEFDVNCSKGTYIRTIIDDIGRELGCGACMTALERTGSGYFRIEDAVSIEELTGLNAGDIEKYLIPMEETLINLGKVQLNDNRVMAFINGNPSDSWAYSVTEETNYGNYYRIYSGDSFIGIGSIENDSIKPQKVINADIQ